MRLPSVLLLVCLAIGCQSKETTEVGVTTVSADTVALDETIDSANNSRQDGTLTTASVAPKDVKQQLPPELEVLLDQSHPLWQLPVLSDLDRARLTQDQQGPYFLQKDLNGDKKVDYVVQLAVSDSVMVYALLRPSKEGTVWQEETLAAKPQIVIEGRMLSPYFLSIPEERQATTPITGKEKKEISGIIINEGGKATLHSWQKGKWAQKEIPTGN